jgi:predicted dinucleotide-binding enzyme
MANKSKVGIIGKGNVGSALVRGLSENGHEVKATGKDPSQVREIGQWADIVILAIPYNERQNALRELGETIDNKPLVDVTNAIAGNMEFQGSLERSGAEELQEAAPDAKVVKAFNTVFAQHMDKGAAQGQPLSLFVAGDDDDAKEQVIELGEDIGFESIDAGPLENARWLEPLGYLNITLAYKTNLGADGGFHYVQRPTKDQPRATRPKRGGKKRARAAVEAGPEARTR